MANAARRNRWGLPAIATIMIGGLGLMHDSEPLAARFESFEPAIDRPSIRYQVIPDAIPYEPESALDERFAEIAARARASTTLSGGLLGFDIEALGEKIEAIVSRISAQAHVSVHARDLATQHVLFDSRGRVPLNPASNQKLLTASAAIDLLGPDYTFSTRLLRTHNELYLVGQGDPALDVDDLAMVVSSVAESLDPAAITRLYVDDTAFSPDAFAPGYPREGPGFAYEAPSGALSLTFNSIEITVAAKRSTRALVVSIDPPDAGVIIDNRGRRGSRRALTVMTRAEDNHTVVEVRGTLPRWARPVVVRRRVADPALYTGRVFASLLGQMTQTEPLAVTRGAPPPGAELLADHTSPPLLEVLESGLAYSNNFIAEQVLRTVAWRMTGNPGDWSDGQDILYGYWAALGGRPDELVVENAAGLSRQGRVSAAGLVDLLSVAHHRIGAGQGLLDVLPAAGDPGTMRTRLRSSRGRVRAKTGTLNGVSGLTGVITSPGGEPRIAFSILTNVDANGRLSAHRRRAGEDQVVNALLAALDRYADVGGSLVTPVESPVPLAVSRGAAFSAQE